jgi:PQQ-like domain
MPIISWISRLFQSLTGVMSPKVQVTRPHSSRRLRHLIKCVAWSLVSAMALPSLAWSGADAATSTIVAAGFGYQAGDVSTITVKIYDPQSGEVLSDDTYELNVKEDSSAKGSQPQERIFAGGVGPGATDLSNFVLRVYDAKTGKFQWEGNLNLTPRDAESSGQLISTVAPRRATVTKVREAAVTAPQPSFLLRALDPETGGLVWEDEFSTDGRGRARMERIVDRHPGEDSNASGLSRSFDFRIRMFEDDGRHMLWEDQFAQRDEEDVAQTESVEERAVELPTWSGQPDRQLLWEL